MPDIWTRLGKLADKIPIVGETIRSVEAAVPQLEDEVTVEVVGRPGASKKTLYFLALSAANSLVRQFRTKLFGKHITPPTGLIMIEYDAADNWVRCTMRYNTTLSNVAVKQKDGDTINDIDELAVYKGPDCDVIGKPFNFTGTFLFAPTGIPRSSTSFGAPQLPFAGRTILTNCPFVKDPTPGFGPPGTDVIPTPNPTPLGDARSRGGVVAYPDSTSTSLSSGGAQVNNGLANLNSTDDCCPRSIKLIPLVFASLSDPGGYGGQVFRPPEEGKG